MNNIWVEWSSFMTNSWFGTDCPSVVIRDFLIMLKQITEFWGSGINGQQLHKWREGILEVVVVVQDCAMHVTVLVKQCVPSHRRVWNVCGRRMSGTSHTLACGQCSQHHHLLPPPPSFASPNVLVSTAALGCIPSQVQAQRCSRLSTKNHVRKKNPKKKGVTQYKIPIEICYKYFQKVLRPFFFNLHPTHKTLVLLISRTVL